MDQLTNMAQACYTENEIKRKCDWLDSYTTPLANLQGREECEGMEGQR